MRKCAEKVTEKPTAKATEEPKAPARRKAKATEEPKAPAPAPAVVRQLVPDKQVPPKDSANVPANDSAKVEGVSARELALRYALELLQAHREGGLDNGAVVSRCSCIRTVLDCADALQFERSAVLDEREADLSDREATLEKQGEVYVGNVGSWRLYMR